MDAQVRTTAAVISPNGSDVRADVGSRPEDAVPAARAPRFDPRTRVLLEAPIVSTILRLATPNVLVMFVQAAVGLIETYFVAKLGTDALAGVALVFPALMLMQMMSAGAMGGGISSAIARALGAGRRRDANALAAHALAIAVGFGLLFMLAVLGGGRWLYSAMGGSGVSLTAALTYSTVVFSGAILVWVFNSLANVIRGTGNMTVPAVITLVGAAALIPLSPCLIFGWGPFPRLGVAGGAVVAMVGTDIGAGQRDRALRAAWIGAGIAAGLTEIIGLCAATVPHLWLSLFDTDPAMLDAGSRYLRVVGPFYGLFGLGMALYFASQGAGRLAWPLLANLTRLAIAAGGGWLALRWSGDVSYVFVALSAALAAFGLMNAWAVASGAWFGPIAWPRARVLVREGDPWK